jgi:hypothetical protein
VAQLVLDENAKVPAALPKQQRRELQGLQLMLV